MGGPSITPYKSFIYKNTAIFKNLLFCTPNSQTVLEEVLPEVLGLVPAKSVIDVSCGTGDWLATFAKFGVNDYLGVDGQWAEKNYKSRKTIFTP